MPVTKTAKRALRAAKRKAIVNSSFIKNLEIAVCVAKKSKSADKIIKATSLLDRAAKKKAIHKNKAARIKSILSKLTPRRTNHPKAKTKPAKKTSKK